MTGKQPRNLDGRPVSSAGRVDMRTYNKGRPRKVTPRYFIRRMRTDGRGEWHVMRASVDGELVERVSRHTTLERAERKIRRLIDAL